MNRWTFAVGLLIAGLAASTAGTRGFAWSDLATVCRIWWDSAIYWGSGWTKIALACRITTAQAALTNARRGLPLADRAEKRWRGARCSGHTEFTHTARRSRSWRGR